MIQEEKGKIIELPAWPKKWGVNFKLHAENNTTVADTPDRLNYSKMAAITEYCLDVCRTASENTFREGFSDMDHDSRQGHHHLL